MRHVPVLLVVTALSAALSALPAHAAVDLTQAANESDRPFERLPDLRLVRGATPKTIPLVITASPGETWQLAVNAPWVTVTPTTGTGNGTAALRFDGAALAALDDPSAVVTIVGSEPGETNSRTIPIRFDIFPNLSTAETPAELRAYAKNPENWPADGHGNAWELWGFLPDEASHGAGAGRNMEAWERTPCAPGEEGDGCVREGQAGLASGMSADTAWLLSTGDPRIVVGVLDSGIRWGERDLVNKFYLNADELLACPPPGADLDAADRVAGFDVNGDGIFNIRDYDTAPWLDDVNANSVRDPQDLIWADDGDGPCSDGIDDDGNGYTDDISGWDFFWNDNDASDDSDFGHGTGEARDSGAEVHDDSGTPGICPRCQILNVRVGDSFVTDVNHFADGTIFVVESGAHVVQEALGTINNTAYAQAAIDWAYQNNVPIIASAADETSYHHNYPGNLEHTIYVHAIVADTDGNFRDASTFLNFNNCTNFGGHLSLSTPGTGCSSEATGNTSGQAGLIASYFVQLQDASQGTDDEAYYQAPFSAEEMYQVLVASADDIDVPGAEKDPEALALQKFPSNEGWDLHFGYGRNNVRRSLELLRDQQIPPEADIESPRWFEVIDPARTPSFEVKGSVSSPRLENLRWSLHVAEGVIGKDFLEIGTGEGAVAGEVLGSVDVRTHLPGLFARAGDRAGVDPEQFSATLELRVTGENPAGETVRGIFRKTFGVRTDDSTHDAFPIFLGASGESSPKLTDLDGDGSEEIVLATANGRLHAIRADGTDLPGFPTQVGEYLPLSDAFCGENDDATPKCHRRARPFQSGFIEPALVRQTVLSSIAVGDLDGDGAPGRDVVVATMDGFLYVFGADGNVKENFPVEIDRATTPDGSQGARRCEVNGLPVIGCRSEQLHMESGFFSSPFLVDLDRDGDLEIVIGGLDQRAYAWHHDGALVNGWPVHLVNDDFAAFEQNGDIQRFDDRIVSSGTVADIFGDGTPMVFFGTNERINNLTTVFLYAIYPDGNAHPGGPFPPGWPALPNGFIPGEILPFLGRGNPNSPVAADFDGDGKDEVVNAGMGGFMSAFDETGEIRFLAASSRDNYGEFSDIDELVSLPVINNPSVADLDGDGVLDMINGTAGTGLVAVASDGGLRSEFDHSVSAWSIDPFTAGGNATNFFLPGFPHRVWDYQFFMNYAVADLEGTGKSNVISGDGGYFVYAPNVDGVEAPGFPKYTQGWHIATPTVGDLDGDQRIDVVANTREGWLWAWKTDGHVGGAEDAPVPAIQWAGFHHDDHNTGNVKTAIHPYTYPTLAEPDDSCAGGCCCNSGGEARSTSVTGLLAGAALLATLSMSRRSRRRREA